MKEFNLLINGRLTPGALTMNVVNPATGEAFAASPRADAKQLDAAVQAARTAFPAWSKLSVAARRAKIMAIADGVEGRLEELARLLTAEQGKPLRDAMGEVGGAAAILRILASLDLPDKVLLDDAKEKIIEHRTPLGLAGARQGRVPALGSRAHTAFRSRSDLVGILREDDRALHGKPAAGRGHELGMLFMLHDRIAEGPCHHGRSSLFARHFRTAIP